MNREEIFNTCRQIDFPETILTDQSLKHNYNYLLLNDLGPTNNTCSQLIQHFHPSLWKAHVRNSLSPFDAWYDDCLLLKAIDNRLKYKGDDLSPRDIRSGLYISKIAPKVSVFRPALAKYLIKKYLNEVDTIFDPCSGYSGRLLGTKALEKQYIGYDINPITVKESNNLIKYFNFKNCSVNLKNSLYTTGEYECLFTCPPYADKENWNQDIEVLSADEWIETMLDNFNCKKYLFVVDHTDKFKKYIVEKLENKSYLQKSIEYVVLITKDN